MKIQNLSWLFCSLFCLGALNAQDYHYATPLSTLAFGSCNRTDLDPKIWEVIEDKNPDVWLILFTLRTKVWKIWQLNTHFKKSFPLTKN